MDEFQLNEIEYYRNTTCIICSEKEKNCSDDHIWLCIAMDFAEKYDEENRDNEI